MVLSKDRKNNTGVMVIIQKREAQNNLYFMLMIVSHQRFSVAHCSMRIQMCRECWIYALKTI